MTGGPDALPKESSEDEEEDLWCTIEATVVSGFEIVAALEIETKLGVIPIPLYHDYDTFKGKFKSEPQVRS